MDIIVNYDGRVWMTEPNPAAAFIGTNIRWVFRSNVSRHRLVWTVTFNAATPFL
jgi:hypothetical protein